MREGRKMPLQRFPQPFLQSVVPSQFGYMVFMPMSMHNPVLPHGVQGHEHLGPCGRNVKLTHTHTEMLRARAHARRTPQSAVYMNSHTKPFEKTDQKPDLSRAVPKHLQSMKSLVVSLIVICIVVQIVSTALTEWRPYPRIVAHRVRNAGH